MPHVLFNLPLPRFLFATYNFNDGRLFTPEILVDPVDWRRFSCEGATNQTSAEMVSDEDVTRFAIVSHQVVKTFRIGTPLDHERKINTDALKTFGCGHGVGMAARNLTKLRSHADRVVIDDVR